MTKSITIAILILAFFSCKNDNSNFQIDVNIDNIPDGRQVILKKQVERKIVNLDTTVVKNGKFSFKGTIQEPIILGIFIDSIKKGAIFPFIGVNDHITVTAYKDSLVKSKIIGSELNDKLTEIRNKREELSKKTQEYLPEFQKATQANDTVTTNRINKEIKKVSDLMDQDDWAFVKSNPNSYVAPLVFNGLMSKPQYKDSVRIVFNSFSDKVKNANISNPIKNYFKYLDKQKAKTATPLQPAK